LIPKTVERAAAIVGRPLPVTALSRFPLITRIVASRVKNVSLRDYPVRATVDVPEVGLVDLDTRDLIQRFLYLFGVWEPALTQLVREVVRPGDTFVDVGANIGYFTLLAARLVGTEGTVQSYEPSPSIGARLHANVSRNGLLDRVTLHAVAVGAQPGEITLFLADDENTGQSSTRPAESASAEAVVAVRTLDETVPTDRWATTRFVKVDAEGDELAVLEGARKLLSALPPDAHVLVEVDEPRLRERGASSTELFALMKRLGYYGTRITNDYTVASYVRRRSFAVEDAGGDTTGDIVFRRR
jgi:FkbM family methyltransferase